MKKSFGDLIQENGAQTTEDPNDPYKRENSRAPREIRSNPVKQMFGNATPEQFEAYQQEIDKDVFQSTTTKFTEENYVV